MKRSKSLWVVCSLILAALALNAGAALACTQQCVHVEGAGPACRQCVDVGYFTGITCGQSGPCGCFFIPNNCNGLAASGPQAQTDLAAVIAPAAGAVCSTESSGNALLNALAG